jgi:uncharacterized membrane protein affecting hemolysin expression
VASDPLFWLVVVACISVLVVLMIGVLGFTRGGEFNRKHANRLMRYRIYAQAVAVVTILAFIFFRGGGT